MATTDCGKTVALGGAASYTFTVNAASTYNSKCMVFITNEDSNCPSGGAATCRGKTLAINGYSNWILQPGQTFILGNQNNTWQYDQPGLWQLQNLQTWYVCHSSGVQTYFSGGTSIGGTTPSDTNDGLSVNSPFATVNGAMLNLRNTVAFNGFGPTIQQCNETFTENNAQAFGALQGYHVFFLQGNPTTPANVTWQCSGSGNACLTARDWGGVIMSGIKFVGTGTGNFALQASQWGVIDFRNVDFGAFPAGTHINVGAGGGINYSSGTYTISGSMAQHILMQGDSHSVLDGVAVSMPNALAFTQFVQMVGSGPYLEMSGTSFTGAGSGAGSTGLRYLVDNPGNLAQASVTFPGNAIGIFRAIGTTFTPGIAFGGAAVGVTYASQTGEYQWTGSQVCFQAYFALTNKGSSTGVATMTGLPLTPKGVTQVYTTFNSTALTFTGMLEAFNNGATPIGLYQNNAGAITQLANTNFANTTDFGVSGCYFVN